MFLSNSLDFCGGAEGGADSWGECSGHYDGLGWGKFLYHMDDSDVGAAFSSKSASSTANPTPRASTTSCATTTPPDVSRHDALALDSIATEIDAISATLDTNLLVSSTMATSTWTAPSSTSSTTSTAYRQLYLLHQVLFFLSLITIIIIMWRNRHKMFAIYNTSTFDASKTASSSADPARAFSTM
ncbi:Chondroitin AC/alginate lyase [Penicillium coprophilum]|uniref:Chondroitin AC/alginate lyase n=1 Tax=Penicillium coprophilum TaxID=36646 RepID=UPI0023A77520|nr:Chondroitin AC/alginate lyase [Penicillium coprophilum]KAJ5173603.1 Chondroitin AC/alginate lyase [Penicillium coprophilum]